MGKTRKVRVTISLSIDAFEELSKYENKSRRIENLILAAKLHGEDEIQLENVYSELLQRLERVERKIGISGDFEDDDIPIHRPTKREPAEIVNLPQINPEVKAWIDDQLVAAGGRITVKEHYPEYQRLFSRNKAMFGLDLTKAGLIFQPAVGWTRR